VDSTSRALEDDAESPKILCVDDEPEVLEGLKRTLFEHFDVQVATTAGEALEQLETAGPFEVIVSDMRMPHVNGAQLLARVRTLTPDTTRILLTGHSEVDAAIAAVNEGAIFRFLTKPCSPTVLVQALHAAVRQYRLIRSEKDLLEQTLVGSMQLMSDVLELAAPSAFQRSSHVRAIVSYVVNKLQLADGWIYESAAALSQIGCVALPSELIESALAGQALSAQEQKAYSEHPELAYRLLHKIPRLAPVAEIVRRQQLGAAAGPAREECHALGGELLHLALELDKAMTQGATPPRALRLLRNRAIAVRPALLDALQGFEGVGERSVVRVVRAGELSTSMTFDEDVRTQQGMLLVSKGRKADLLTIERLRRFAAGPGIVEPFRVLVSLATSD
jgi:CheY-like chemotaxis protein